MITPYERNFGCRVSDDYSYKGLKTVVMENEKLRVSILVDKGTDIFEFLYKVKDIDFMWKVRPGVWDTSKYIPSSASGSGFFMDYYQGCWQEIMPNGGSASFYKGAEIGQHGEISLIPWDYQILLNEEEKISVKFWTRTQRFPFYLEKIISLVKDKSVLFIEEKLVNEAEEDMELMWGHHPAFGQPFLDENCVIDVKAKKVVVHSPKYSETSRLKEGEFNWPNALDNQGKKIDLSRVPPPSLKVADLCYIKDLEEGFYALTNLKKKIGFGISFDKKVFKYIWYWQEFKGGFGYPWWGRTYNIALEPWSSYPAKGLQEAIKSHTQIKLKPHQEKKSYLTAVVYEGGKRVKKITKEGKVIFV